MNAKSSAKKPAAKIPQPVTVDFESFAIENRPHYPPLPVGVSILWPGQKPQYFAWGHKTGNNCGWDTAARELAKAWEHPDGILFHNAKFDLDVAEVHFGLKPPPWERIHDTLFLIFLDDPHQSKLDLKSSAHRLLNMPASERDEVGDWLCTNQPLSHRGITISRSVKSDFYYMKYLPLAPATLVGPYANGDVERTKKLFDLLYAKTLKRKMGPPYDRERRSIPVTLEMERTGVPIDVETLRADVARYQKILAKLNQWLLSKLRVAEPEDFNLDSGQQLVEQLTLVKKVDLIKLGHTPGGDYKSDQESLERAITDPQLSAVLGYRSSLCTCLRTFMEPWLAQAEESNGWIYTTWHQTRADKKGSTVGTRTGRLSSTPNFQNIPNVFEPYFAEHWTAPPVKKGEKPVKCPLPAAPFAGLPPLPNCRQYVKAPKGFKLGDRDYSQQELRILGHYEGGYLQQRYNENPRLDLHDLATELINKMLNTHYKRKPIKNTGFGLIYGMGIDLLAAKSKIAAEEAKRLRDAYLQIFPGLKDMYKDMKAVAKANEPIRTWGGREYYCEPPKVVKGRMRTFDYKLINVLVQGSAADCTKEAAIRFYDMKKPSWKLLLTVHDELLIMAPETEIEDAMEALRKAMESIEFDVAMLSDGNIGQAWSELKETKE